VPDMALMLIKELTMKDLLIKGYEWLRDRFMTEWNVSSTEGKVKLVLLSIIALLIAYNLIFG